MNYPQIMSPVPFASESGGHIPQLIWERRPCLRVMNTSSCTRVGAVACSVRSCNSSWRMLKF